MKNRDVLICILLGLISLVPRLLLISKGPFSPDSLNLAIIAEKTLATGQLHAQYGTGYPLLVLLTTGFVALTKTLGIADPVVGTNLMGVCLGSVSVAVFYLLVRRLLDRPAAVMSAAVLSASPIFVGTTVYGTGQAAEHIFLGGGLILLWEYVRTVRWKWLVLSAAVFGLAGAVRLQDLAFISPAIIFFLLFMRSEDGTPGVSARGWARRGKELLLFGAIIFLVIGLFHSVFLLGPGSEEYVTRYRRFSKATFSTGTVGIRMFMFGQIHKWLTQNFSVLGLTAMLLGILFLLARRTRLALFLLLWILGPLTFYVLIDTTIPRLLVILLPPMAVFIGSMLATVYARGSRLSRGVSVGLCALLVLIMFMEVLPFVRFRHQHALVPDMVRWVREHTPPDAHMILLDEHLFYEHYGKFPVLARPLPHGTDTEQRFADFKARLDGLFARGVPVYSTGVGLYSDDVQQRFPDFLKRHYNFTVIGAPFFEDWHHGELKNFIFRNIVIRISPREGT